MGIVAVGAGAILSDGQSKTLGTRYGGLHRVHEGRDYAAPVGAGTTRVIPDMPRGPKRTSIESRETDAARPAWARVKASLEGMDRIGLMALIRDLYNIDDLNRRVLHERFTPNDATFQRYRDLVRASVFPDPFTNRPIRLRQATATIREYQLATGNLTGTVDLMLDFVEAGTAQAADLGYGDATYFAALERKVSEIVDLLDTLPSVDRRLRTERLIQLGKYQGAIGWGYGDFLADVASTLRDRSELKPASRDRRSSQVDDKKRRCAGRRRGRRTG